MDHPDSGKRPDFFGMYEWWMLAIVGLLTLAPLWPVGLASTDDMVYSQLGYTHDWDSPLTNAVGMGRFYYMYSGYLYMAPYLVKHALYFKLFALGPLVAIPLLLGRLLQKLTGDGRTSRLTVLIYFLFLQMYTDYYPTAAFPFVFTFSISLYLVSLSRWIDYLRHRGNWTWPISLVTFVLAILPYETFVILFSVTIALATFSFHWRNGRSKVGALKSSVGDLRLHGIALALYAVAYLGFLLIPTPDGYSRDHYSLGAGGFDVLGFANTLWHFSTSALPLASLSYATPDFLAHVYWEDAQHYGGILDIIRTSTAEWWARAILSSVLIVGILRQTPVVDRFTTLGIAVAGTVVFVISPLLHALTLKYQQVVAHGVFVYLPTFFSYLGVVTVAVAILLWVNSLLKGTAGFWLWLSLLAISTGFISLVHSFNNHYVALYQAHHAFTWTVMDEVAIAPSFQSIPDGATIFTPSLPRATVTYDMLAPQVGDYWEGYLQVLTGKSFKLIYTDAELAQTRGDAPIYYLRLEKMPKQFDAFVVLSRLDFSRSTEGSRADEFDLMTYSRYKEFRLGFSLIGDTNSSVAIQGNAPSFATNGRVYSDVTCGVPGPLTSTHVAAAGVDLDSIELNYFR